MHKMTIDGLDPTMCACEIGRNHDVDAFEAWEQNDWKDPNPTSTRTVHHLVVGLADLDAKHPDATLVRNSVGNLVFQKPDGSQWGFIDVLHGTWTYFDSTEESSST